MLRRDILKALAAFIAAGPAVAAATENREPEASGFTPPTVPAEPTALGPVVVGNGGGVMTGKRGTGRTTRMLQRAIQLAGEGKHVYVVAANKRQAMQLEIQAGRCGGPHTIRAISGIPVGRVSFITEETCRTYDPITMKVWGGEPNSVVLVDHSAIEQRFGAILSMWTQFDEEPS